LIIAYIDGGSRGNPGPAGFGVRIENGGGAVVEEIAEPIGRATNNVAEYHGLLAALEWAKRHGHRRLHVRSDSELLVNQMRGVYKVKNPGLQPLHQQARRLTTEIGRVTFEHVPREQNAHADRLANLAMDGKQVVVHRPPSDVPPSPVGGNETSASPLPAEPDPFTASERAVRMFVYRHFVETGRAPDVSATAAAVQIDRREVVAALRKLVAAHALVVAPASTNIWMAHPFSAVPTAYPVTARGRTYWGNCAWDAAGILALLGDGESRTRCPDCAAALTVTVRDRRISGEGLVHFAVPPRNFWDNIGYT